jgi:Domain of unknown function (DUF4436)
MLEAPENKPFDLGGVVPSPTRFSPLFRRGAVLTAILLAGLIAYAIVLIAFRQSKEPQEVEFGVPINDAQVRLYLQPIQVDAVNDSMQVRISVVPDPSLGDAALTIADRDFLLKIRRGKQVEQVQVRANQPLPEVTFDFDLDKGDVRDYPLDRYVTQMTFAASDRANDGSERALPIHVTAWEGVFGFSVKGETATAQRSGDLPLQFKVSRTTATSIFGVAIYGAMMVMTLCALTIGSLVFLGIRRVEMGQIATLGAIIFALPALRNTLPGAPPLGVRADVYVFFWAELALMVALCLLVARWTRQGSPP